jgi:hypothetical protein
MFQSKLETANEAIGEEAGVKSKMEEQIEMKSENRFDLQNVLITLGQDRDADVEEQRRRNGKYA